MADFDICFVLNEKYLPQAKITINSLCDFSSEHLHFHVLGTEELPELTEICKKHNSKITYYKPELGCLSQVKNLKYYSEAVLYKPLIPIIFKNKLNKILFLDVDILVNTDITKIWNCFNFDYPIGGVIDANHGWAERILKLKQYINTGVILFNIPKIWEKFPEYNKNLISIISHWNSALRFGDQDIINLIFSGSINYIDHRWNISIPAWECSVGKQLEQYGPKALEIYPDFIKNHSKENIDKGFIFHFTGPYKPLSGFTKNLTPLMKENYFKYVK